MGAIERRRPMTIGVVVGNPKPDSRTLQAGILGAQLLTGSDPDLVIDVVKLGPGLLGFGDADVAAAVESVRECDLLMVGSPTYKGAYTGVLKCFLDQFPGGGLAGVTAFVFMLGAGPGHALAPELLLRPVLVELGASCPARGLYLLESVFADEASWEPWLSSARPFAPTAAAGARSPMS
jgi:FMN reductase